MAQNWQQTFPHLSEIDDAAVDELMTGAGTIDMPANTTAFRQGDACSNYLLILESRGRIHVKDQESLEKHAAV